jgi:hypothetical protein
MNLWRSGSAQPCNFTSHGRLDSVGPTPVEPRHAGQNSLADDARQMVAAKFGHAQLPVALLG